MKYAITIARTYQTVFVTNAVNADEAMRDGLRKAETLKKGEGAIKDVSVKVEDSGLRIAGR